MGLVAEVLDTSALGDLLALLVDEGRTLIGPTVRDGAIVYDEIGGLSELPEGWTASQSPGSYRLERRKDRALFGFASSGRSFRPFFHVPVERLVTLRRSGEGWSAVGEPTVGRKLALIGARACDLAALAVQDRVFVEGAFPDPRYAARRANTFVIAVNCGEAGGTCFCTSMGTGPRATHGYDLSLTEVLDGEHRFVVEAATAEGARLLAAVRSRAANVGDLAAANRAVEHARDTMGRSLDTRGIRDLLFDNLEHPRWDDVAARCLSCTNCTLVCPTCFCGTIDEVASLEPDVVERRKRWDSCFTEEHSYLHGGAARPSVRARYRQWLTHKLAGWIDQFGSSGCVGCGRCITWCPAGIDITEEVAAIRGRPVPTAREQTP